MGDIGEGGRLPDSSGVPRFFEGNDKENIPKSSELHFGDKSLTVSSLSQSSKLPIQF